MVVWFTVLGAARAAPDPAAAGRARGDQPGAHRRLLRRPGKAFLALGSIFLVVTGGEALYADMGHFGRRPIALVWYAIVLPALLLNYFGQAALLIEDPRRSRARSTGGAGVGLTPLAVLATMASVIASQALISGAFSLTVQAVQLDYLPRVEIRHTSASTGPGVRAARELGADDRLHRARARVPDVEQPRRGVRHRRHHDDGDHDDAVLPSCATRWGWSTARSVVTSCRCCSSTPLPRRQRARRSRPAVGSRWSSARLVVQMARGGAAVSSSPTGSTAASGRSRGARRGARRKSPCAGHRGVHVQGPRQGAAGARQQPRATTRCSTRRR